MKTEIFSSGLTYRPQASGENCQRKRTFLQMLSPEWRFLKTPFSCTLNRELQLQRPRRQRKRHCLKDFAVGRDFFYWRKTRLSRMQVLWTTIKFRGRKRNSQSCVYVRHETSLEGISSRSRAVTAKKCTKKCAARAKLLFCFSKPIASLTFSLPSSDLKVAILKRKRSPWSRHYSFQPKCRSGGNKSADVRNFSFRDWERAQDTLINITVLTLL